MDTIYKYPIPITDEFNIWLPNGAKVLCVQTQCDEPFIWAVVNTKAQTHPRAFQLCGTGHPCEGIDPQKYIGTFQLHGGSLIFHLFEK